MHVSSTAIEQRYPAVTVSCDLLLSVAGQFTGCWCPPRCRCWWMGNYTILQCYRPNYLLCYCLLWLGLLCLYLSYNIYHLSFLLQFP